MNYDHLPQPPEGVLDPKLPWSRINPNSRLWLILKARLTGRPIEGYNYSSYVNITEADADRLIANMKKDPRGYPSLDQESGTPVQWMERQRLYQEWLVEAYLENPFREQVDKKIEEAEQERRLQEIQEEREQRKREQEERKRKRQEKEQQKVSPAPAATPAPIPAPVPPPEPATPPPAPVEAKPVPLRDEDLVAPNQMPSNVSRALSEYGDALDAIGNQLSQQNSIINRNLGYLRRINEDLGDAEFLLGQLSENYQEALDDFESEERKKAARKKIIGRIISPFKRKEPSQKISSPSPEKNESWWNVFSNNKPQQKLAKGGISYTGVSGKGDIIKPGIYDNPTEGQLAPGTAVIPLNRNYGKTIMGQYDIQKYEQSLGDVLKKSINVLLGSGVAVYGSVLRAFGPLAGYFNHSIPGILNSLSTILDISRNTIINMFGGPAYAGTAPNDKEMKSFYKSWKAYMDKNNLYFPGGVNAPGDKNIQGAGEGQDSGGPEVEWAGGLEYAPPNNPFADRDGQETGIDISLKGKGTNGYGRGLTIRNPWDNLYYFAKVPKGFQNPGSPTRGIQGTSKRVPKGRGPSGFGHWATYYIKDSDGTFYELMIGHLDRPAPSWNDTGNGVKLNKGVKIGVQGASGSSVGNTPEGTYDHMTTHINSPGRRNPKRSGELLIQWARDLNSYKPSNMPKQPPVAKLQSGGWVKGLFNILSNFRKPRGLSIRGVQAGFTGMSREGFEAIMRGAKFRNPNKSSLIGKGSQPVLGHGAYSAPTAKGASRYVKPGGGIVKTIVPGNARGINFIEPQSVVPPATFDKGKLLADKLLSGQYSNSILANRLRSQLISGAAQNVGIGLGKLFSKAFGIMNAPVVGDMLFPEPTAPGTLDYARSQGLLKPLDSKPVVKSKTIEVPSQSSVSSTVQSSSKPQFVNLDVSTNTVLTSTQMRRM